MNKRKFFGKPSPLLSRMFCRYPRAIDIFETVAQQSLDNHLLKYSVKGYLLNATLCQICSRDSVAIKKAIDRYQVNVIGSQAFGFNGSNIHQRESYKG